MSGNIGTIKDNETIMNTTTFTGGKRVELTIPTNTYKGLPTAAKKPLPGMNKNKAIPMKKSKALPKN
jgi:hypothetical protein